MGRGKRKDAHPGGKVREKDGAQKRDDERQK